LQELRIHRGVAAALVQPVAHLLETQPVQLQAQVATGYLIILQEFLYTMAVVVVVVPATTLLDVMVGLEVKVAVVMAVVQETAHMTQDKMVFLTPVVVVVVAVQIRLTEHGLYQVQAALVLSLLDIVPLLHATCSIKTVYGHVRQGLLPFKHY
jgi:hypothetical protein